MVKSDLTRDERRPTSHSIGQLRRCVLRTFQSEISKAEACNGISCSTIEFQSLDLPALAVHAGRCTTRQEEQDCSKPFSASSKGSLHLRKQFTQNTVRVIQQSNPGSSQSERFRAAVVHPGYGRQQHGNRFSVGQSFAPKAQRSIRRDRRGRHCDRADFQRKLFKASECRSSEPDDIWTPH